jgi:predicted permease
MPSTFDFPSDIEIWVPLKKNAGYAQGRGNNNFFIIARIRDGISFDQAAEETTGIMSQIAGENPVEKQDWGMRPQLLHEVFYGNMRPVMLVFMAAVALVLLIACANVSSLFLARATSRQREVAVRFALGASRWRVLQSLLTESLLISGLGGALSLLVMLGGVEAIQIFGADSLPRVQEISLNLTVIGFTVLVTILAALIFGVAPSVRGTRFNLMPALKEGGKVTGSSSRLRLRGVLVTGQVALSLMLLIGAGLLIRSLVQLQREDPGFPVEGLLSLRIQVPAFQYSSPAEVELLYTGVLEELRALPDIADAAGTDRLPFQGNGPYNGLYRPENPPEKPGDLLPAFRRFVTDGYFRTMGIPVLTGREFEPSDAQGGAPVVVVNRALAESYFGEEDALGKILVLNWGDGVHLEIIGIVGDVPESGPGAQIPAFFYLPFRQYPQVTMQLTMRCVGDPLSLVGAVRTVIREAEPEAPIWDVATMEQRFDDTLVARRFLTILLGIFAAVALILASMGLFGVLTYYVSQRTYEMGIRIAMGAGRSSVVGLVLRKGLLLTLIGIGVGLAGGIGFSVLLESLLFETAPIDPVTYGLVSMILIAVSAGACLVPARRAIRVDPIITMRSE